MESIYELSKAQHSPKGEKQYRYLDRKEKHIPFILYTKKGKLFEGQVLIDCNGCFSSPFFILKKIDQESGCADLEFLEPVGIDGCTVDFPGRVFSLQRTNQCLTVSLDHFCALQTFPASLVNRHIPDINPKC